MDNNPDALGQDLEVQVAPQPTQPVLAYNSEATFVSRHPFTGELTERDAYSISRAFQNVEALRGDRELLQSRIARVEALLKETLTEVSDSEWIDFIKEIAQALDITLTRTYSVTATVQHTFEVEVGIGEDEPSEHDFTFSVTSYDWDIECEREDVTDFEAEEQ